MMKKYSYIKEDLCHYCRDCLNEANDINLSPEDCKCFMYPMLCHRCGMVKNIVTDIRLSKKIKLFFGAG